MWKLIIIIFIIFNIIAFVIPKNINKIEIYATCFFAFSYGLITDIILDLHYHLYGYIHKGFDWGGLLSTFLYFPSISYLFLNFFPFEKRLLNKIYYILGWSIFSIIFEWFTLITGFFYYNGWKFWYSGLLYPLIFSSLVLNMKFVKRINQYADGQN
ncbi:MULTISPECIES: CBO0543 family protein [Heyndrickxia]|uniref:CBO0543 family protein n=1 Tax=Heyndrickxia TaxID=2837504 RepID=UPI003571610F